MSAPTAPVAAGTTPAATPPDRLTIEQRYLLALIADGHTHSAIARRHGNTTSGIQNQLSRIYRRLGARNACHAVAIAIRAGLLPTPDQKRAHQQ